MEEKKWKKEEIVALAEKPYKDLTPEERRLVNLNKGFWDDHPEMRNTTGSMRTSNNWSAQFRRLMNSKGFLRTILSSTPKEWEGLVGETPAEFIAACIIATVTRGLAKKAKEGATRLDADTRASIALLNKIGYGDKVVYESDNGFFEQPTITYEVIPDRTDFSKNES